MELTREDRELKVKSLQTQIDMAQKYLHSKENNKVSLKKEEIEKREEEILRLKSDIFVNNKLLKLFQSIN